MSIENILIAVDFSSCAEGVVRRGGELARKLGARVCLVNVVRAPDLSADTRIPVREGAEVEELTVEQYLRRAAGRRLARYADLLGEHDSPRVVVRYGEPAAEIVEEARACGASMIVVGTKGRHGVARAIYGSVAEEVVRAADVPVTTIRSHWVEGCAARSCNQCVREPSPAELRVLGEQCG